MLIDDRDKNHKATLLNLEENIVIYSVNIISLLSENELINILILLF